MKFIPPSFQTIDLHPEGAREAGAALYLELEEVFQREMGFYPTAHQACQALAYALGDSLLVAAGASRRQEVRAEMLNIIDQSCATEIKRFLMGGDTDG